MDLSVQYCFSVLLIFTLQLCVTLCLPLDHVTVAETRCEHVADELFCDGMDIDCIVLPENVKTVHLNNFNTTKLQRGTFQKNSNWTKIEKLVVSGSGNNITELQDFVFLGLTSLKYLGIHQEQLFKVYPYAFMGINNLTTFNFSKSSKVPAPEVLQSLRIATLPKLDTVVLNMLHAYFVEPVIMLEDFFKAISGNKQRKLKYLDISNINIGIVDYNYLFDFNLCESLEHFIARNSTFQSVQNYIQFRTCNGLKVFDISGAIIPNTRQRVDFRTSDFLCLAVIFYFSIEEYYFPSIFHAGLSPEFVMTNFTLDMRQCLMKVRKVVLSNNLLKFINISAILNKVTEESFQWLDASHNILEYLSPKLLAPSINMIHLDLTQNNLHVMQERYPADFEVLIKPITKLEYFSLASNGLTTIPHKMFQTNAQLKHLNLAGNQLTHVSFKLDHLKDLKVLQLAGNHIKYIEPRIRSSIENIAGLKVDLEQNMIQCSCDESDRDYLQWVQNNLQDTLAGATENYQCDLHGKTLKIQNNAADEVDRYCKWQITKRNMEIFLPIAAVLFLGVIIFVTVMVVRIRRARKMKQYFSNVLTLLKLGIFPKKHLVFVSFCSEDDDLVSQKILPELTRRLEQMTDCSQNLVCTGDTQFRPGYSISEELIRCIDESAVTILAVSKSFCNKDWCKMETHETYDQKKPIIVLMLETVAQEDMDNVLRKIFQRFTHAAWIPDENGGYLKPDWPVFCEAIIGLAGQNIEENIEMSTIQNKET